MFENHFQSFSDIADPKAARPRVAALRQVMMSLGLDGFLVPRADEHQGEYVPDCDERLAYISGFTGSAGIAVILAKKAYIFSDGRYVLQIAQQVDAKLFTPVPVHTTPVHTWLETGITERLRIGYDARLHTVADIERYSKALAKSGGQLVAVEHNLVDLIWQDRPSAPMSLIAIHPDGLAGETAQSKLQRIHDAMGKEGIDALLVSDPHNLAWAFNIRGSDVGHTPIALGYALIPNDGPPTLFFNPAKVSGFTLETLAGMAELASPEEIYVALRQAAKGGRKIRLDSATAGASFKELVERSGGIADSAADPITRMKAVKNEAEIAGTRAAHLRDGAALVRFLAWLDRETPKGQLTEIEAVKALESFRRETGKLKDVSFPTISGFGPNGAIVHYRVSEATNLRLGKGLFLVDSGGQYEDGTTDVTRTICIGKPTSQMKDRFTRVLKGMIAISQVVFPEGTTGAQLDTLARQFLWAQGLDYDHGTGHGVGSYLSVHEGPQRIAKTGTAVLESGMILSNEPGYYKTGRYGIRVENLILTERRSIKGAEREMLGFETLTLAPIDRRLITRSLLLKPERDWLNAYHARVLAALSALLPPDARDWLGQACKPI